MTDRELEEIQYYIPGDPDPSLEDNEYFYQQLTMGKTRIIRVFALDIFPRFHGSTQYGIYQQRGGRLFWVDSGYGDYVHGVTMGDLYDNKEDCRNQTHMGCSWWQQLRQIQKGG